MKKNCLLLCLTLFCLQGFSQFSISENHRYLLKNGKPFFWLGDTGWEFFHRLTTDEANQYLKRRSEQGFTVIQAVILAELDGLHTPNMNGDTPLKNDDPAQPKEAYFTHVDSLIDKADFYHLNFALLPTWGDKINKSTWGAGPEIFNPKNAEEYGKWLGNRYQNKTNIIWVLGGDRNPRNESDIDIWRAMASGILEGTHNKAIISYHPQPCDSGSATWFGKDAWLSFNMFQNGHCRDNDVYDRIQTAYNMQPTKPVMDAEPIYEDHPVCFNVTDLGTSSAYDVRKYAYLDLFSGAFGHTYGCHDIWQFYSSRVQPLNGPHMYWMEALNLPGANQMQYVRKLMEWHPMIDRVPDQTLIAENNNTTAERIQATRGNDYAYVYSAMGKLFTCYTDKIKAKTLRAYWFDPRNGKSTIVSTFGNTSSKQFTPPSKGYGQDWVLVLEDADKYPAL